MRWLLILLGLVILARVGYYVAYERDPVPAQVSETFAQLKNKDPIERSRAAQLLGQQGGPRVVAPLLAALKDTDPKVRRNVVAALGDIGADAAPSVPALIEGFTGAGDWDAESRAAAARALVDIAPDSKQVIDALVKQLLNAEGPERVRLAAAEELAAYAATSAEAAAALKETAAGAAGPVQEAASKSLEADAPAEIKAAP